MNPTELVEESKYQNALGLGVVHDREEFQKLAKAARDVGARCGVSGDPLDDVLRACAITRRFHGGSLDNNPASRPGHCHDIVGRDARGRARLGPARRIG